MAEDARSLSRRTGSAHPPRSMDWRRAGARSLLWLLGLVTLGLLIWWLGWDQIWSALRVANPRVLLLLCLLQAVTLLACAGQLWYVLRCSGISLPFSTVFSIYMAGGFVESVTPALKFGGEGVKIYLLRQQTRAEYQHLMGAFLTYKFLSIVPFSILLLSTGLLYVHPLIGLPVPVIGLLFLLGGLGCWALLRRQRASSAQPSPVTNLGKARRFVAGSLACARQTVNGRRMAFMVLIWTGIWMLYPVKLAMVGLGLGLRLPVIPLAVVLYSSYLISMLPLAPGGLGSFEGSLVLFLGGLAVAPQTALAMVLMLRSVTYWFPLLPMGYYALRVLLNPAGPNPETRATRTGARDASWCAQDGSSPVR